jgi:hypothetical protein
MTPAVFWYVASSSLAHIDRRFVDASTLIMRAMNSISTSRRENLKSHKKANMSRNGFILVLCAVAIDLGGYLLCTLSVT